MTKERAAASITRQMTERIVAVGATIDYVALVDPDSLAAVSRIDGGVEGSLDSVVSGFGVGMSSRTARTS